MTDTLRNQIAHELRMSGAGLMEGWTVPERGLELAQIILEHKPHVVVEIGVFGGRSLIAQALALRENGHGVIYGIDPWKTEAAIEAEQDPAGRGWWAGCDLNLIHNKAMKAVWDLKLDEWATVIRAASQHVHHLFPQIDVLGIDGNHSEVASCRDVTLYVPRVRPGGVIWFDDSDWKSTQPALAIMDKYCSLIQDTGHTRTYLKL